MGTQTNAVAPQGTAFTERQAWLLKRYTKNLILAFDADSAGINAAIRSLASFLPAGLNARVVMFGDGEDPDVGGEVGDDELGPTVAGQEEAEDQDADGDEVGQVGDVGRHGG